MGGRFNLISSSRGTCPSVVLCSLGPYSINGTERNKKEEVTATHLEQSSHPWLGDYLINCTGEVGWRVKVGFVVP